MVFSEYQQDPVIGLFSRAVVRVGLVPLLNKPLEAGDHGYRN
jgi:hypothetical protein